MFQNDFVGIASIIISIKAMPNTIPTTAKTITNTRRITNITFLLFILSLHFPCYGSISSKEDLKITISTLLFLALFSLVSLGAIGL